MKHSSIVSSRGSRHGRSVHAPPLLQLGTDEHNCNIYAEAYWPRCMYVFVCMVVKCHVALHVARHDPTRSMNHCTAAYMHRVNWFALFVQSRQ